MIIANYDIGSFRSFEPKNIYVKDAKDFLNNYDEFAEMVFFKVVGDKVHIKIIAPLYVKEVKESLKKIKE